MCTAVSFLRNCHYFGRNLDYEMSFGDNIVVVPRNFCFNFRHAGIMREHYAMMGMAHIEDGCPLFYECVNEKGLAVASLNFVDYAFYGEPQKGKFSLAPYEIMPFIVGQCADLSEARELLEKICLVDETFNSTLPVAELHWMISDRSGSVVVESTKSGFNVYDNPMGVLTNNPEFPQQSTQLNNYMGLSAKPPEPRFCSNYPFKRYSRGMGAIGLPGDFSSESRFVRAAFIKANSVCGDAEEDCVAQFFHIMTSVENPRGCCELEDGVYQITQYTCCCNCDKGIYYYKYYDNHQVYAIDMHRENLCSSELKVFKPQTKGEIRFQN